MKVVVAWLCMIAIALVAAGSCSIKHSSEQFECEINADCTDLGDGRVCSEGLCVIPGGTMKDAAAGDGPRDAFVLDAPAVCPAQCTTCNLEKKECAIDCENDTDPATCTNNIKCPAGYSCNIKCNTASSCRAGVDCTAATGCKIDCAGFGSCRNLACSGGACDIICSGAQSCVGVACNQSCACGVKCDIGSNCFNVTCSKQACDIGQGCSTQPTGCNTCP